jgi:hypothetical protein
MRRLSALALLPLLLGGPPGAAAGEVRDAVAVLDVFSAALPHYVPEAAPVRFALLQDGRVFVGGSRTLFAGTLSPREARDLERRFADLRKLPGIAGAITIGPGDRRQRLRLFKGGRPLDLTITGDPADPRPGLAPLGALLADLERFWHPSLRPYEPQAYALSAREGTLRGGCRRWTAEAPSVAESVFAPVGVKADLARGWPTGATPASVCSGDRTYVVTLRPLLPVEQP